MGMEQIEKSPLGLADNALAQFCSRLDEARNGLITDLEIAMDLYREHISDPKNVPGTREPIISEHVDQFLAREKQIGRVLREKMQDKLERADDRWKLFTGQVKVIPARKRPS